MGSPEIDIRVLRSLEGVFEMKAGGREERGSRENRHWKCMS